MCWQPIRPNIPSVSVCWQWVKNYRIAVILFDSPGLPTIGGYPGEQGVRDTTPLGVVLSFGSNQTAFIGVDYANKKGGYLLSRIALFDKVYHRRIEDMARRRLYSKPHITKKAL